MPAATPVKRARQRANKINRKADDLTQHSADTSTLHSPLHPLPAPPSLGQDIGPPDDFVSLGQLLTTLADRFELQDPEAGPVIAEAFRSGICGGSALATQRLKARYDDLDEHVQAFILDYESCLQDLQAAAYERGVADERARREAEANTSVQHPEPSLPSTTTPTEPDEPVPEHYDLKLLSPNQCIVFKHGFDRGYAEGTHIMLERMSEKNAEAAEGAFEEGPSPSPPKPSPSPPEPELDSQVIRPPSSVAHTSYGHRNRYMRCPIPSLPRPVNSHLTIATSQFFGQIRIPGRGPALTIGPPEAVTPDDAVPTSLDLHACHLPILYPNNPCSHFVRAFSITLTLQALSGRSTIGGHKFDPVPGSIPFLALDAVPRSLASVDRCTSLTSNRARAWKRGNGRQVGAVDHSDLEFPFMIINPGGTRVHYSDPPSPYLSQTWFLDLRTYSLEPSPKHGFEAESFSVFSSQIVSGNSTIESGEDVVRRLSNKHGTPAPGTWDRLLQLAVPNVPVQIHVFVHYEHTSDASWFLSPIKAIDRFWSGEHACNGRGQTRPTGGAVSIARLMAALKAIQSTWWISKGPFTLVLYIGDWVRPKSFPMESTPSHPSQWIPQFLLSPGLRLFYVRLVLVTGLLTMGFTIHAVETQGSTVTWVSALLITVPSAAWIHQVLAALGPHFPLLVWVDFVWMIVETGRSGADKNTVLLYLDGIPLVMTMFRDLNGLLKFVGMSKKFVPLLLSRIALQLNLVALLALKALAIVHGWGTKPLSRRVDLNPEDGTRSWWRHAAHVLFGRRLWKAHVPGESKSIFILRGFLASFAIAALILFGVYQAIIYPIFEVGRVPYRYSRTDAILSSRELEMLAGLNWTLILVWQPHLGATASIIDSITVTPWWIPDSHMVSTPDPACRVYDESGIARVYCEPPWSALPAQERGYLWEDFFPNFEIRVDFTDILGFAGPRSKPSRAFDSLQVYIGLINDTQAIIENTDPILLFPGANLLGVLRPAFREITPDPMLDSSGNRNISTLSLTTRGSSAGWIFIEDYRNKSVLGGLSVMGGLGSLLSTSWLLEAQSLTKLCVLMVGTKPNSPFGFLHSIRAFQKAMADRCDERYPKLWTDVQGLKANPGLSAYIFDTMIDIEPLGYDTHETTAPDSSHSYGPLDPEQAHDGAPRGNAEGAAVERGM
ncbi:hypothetical protein FA13DRAFT_1873039 [Coprinellus micaceus]|uniref:Uncharacterized protein n=1 Tax=Coprinellus micaceus TaxID=71717 RepID=A0A4Y7T2E7_COPMI|nr:hypothetical protein FA13DRAFT_1873039 [Coprinellus micaceus]